MTGAAAGRPIVIGSGIAGLLTALCLAPAPVLLVTQGALGDQSSSALAQGGLAAAMGDDDTPALHRDDTLCAGAGLCDPGAAGLVADAAPAAVAMLSRFGVVFDKGDDGSFTLGLEAAHSRRRIVHAAGDGTGREIVRALTEAVRATPSIMVLEHTSAERLLLRGRAICGVLASGRAGRFVLSGRSVVVATGGIGGLFEDTTNPVECWGKGLALAARAGAVLADMEFMQFHPTALATESRPMRLVSEAVRGEGAVLVDETGHRFAEALPGAELAPRDQVSRAVARHLAEGHSVFLDVRERPGAAFPEMFPAIASFCHVAGIDPLHDPIPVRPAAHYHMGGIAVDEQGRSSVQGLWACGEAACTGLHGANRLASNSLIEAAVMAAAVAESIRSLPAQPLVSPERIESQRRADPAVVRPIVSQALGLIRDRDTLSHAISRLSGLAAEDDAALVGLMMAVAAHDREESRGAHCRRDFPQTNKHATRAMMTCSEAFLRARELGSRTGALAQSA
ncbi:L-aspartate oxidase [Nitratireductor indicus]|uniref:L-aspartate oxidase n=1 Tax=Nitratireductor indicus TaxID=721133 RepID=UPI002876CA4F|nr:L-aspartate oxidase [Nitratireductor indicus]MDS1138686.1 L-aspartate oxidase [Nitratireductor indicus]